MLTEHRSPDYPVTVALFNAFNLETYFGIDAFDTQTTGWKNCEQLLRELKAQHTCPIRFIGSGTQLFEKQITEIMGAQAIIPEPLPLAPSLKTIGLMATEQFNAGTKSIQLMPLYLKQPILENRTVKFV
jgi:tRNA A37 threonylcarbamoyladenosine modification protein TsaB